jgi:hypothetical protein
VEKFGEGFARAALEIEDQMFVAVHAECASALERGARWNLRVYSRQ